jgi:hypothetical protein
MSVNKTNNLYLFCIWINNIQRHFTFFSLPSDSQHFRRAYLRNGSHSPDNLLNIVCVYYVHNNNQFPINKLYVVCRYGDRFPRSVQGRVFTILWFIVGWIMTCLFVASVASSLCVKIVIITKNPVQGGKVIKLFKFC